jgi:Sugar phosphate isomerases/epimerases
MGGAHFPFRTCLNASTLFPFNLNIREQIRVAAEAGYDGIEIWMRDLEAHAAAGGSIAELKDCAASLGIAIPNAIAFFRWADADDEARRRGFAQAGREMEMLAELGCPAVAAPPYGDVEGVGPDRFAAHFAELVKLGRSFGVEPYLEFWGRAKRLNRLEEAAAVLDLSGLDGAKLLLDPFHMHVGGSRFELVGALSGDRIGIVHANDYPAEPPRETIADRDRVFPGEGVAPLKQLAADLYRIGYRGYLSLELFIEDFGGRSALDIARYGLEALKKDFSVYNIEGER